MHDFPDIDGQLYCEQVPVAKIAKAVGTPCYIYSHQTLTRHFQAVDGAFASIPHVTAFAMKANSNLAILRLFASLGGGADIVSGGELYRALKAGVPRNKIVFAGVGKTREEIAEALKAKILSFNVESAQELATIDEVARKLKTRARISLRVNPHIDPKTHPYISTGLKKSKFGIGIDQALDHYKQASTLKGIEIVGVHHHIGSQLTQVQPFVEALARVLELVDALRTQGVVIRSLDMGGGLGIPYKDETPPSPRDLANAVLPLLRGRDLTLIMEPGRVLVGNAGILVTKVLYTKEGAEKNFVVVDAGMNDLLRPSLYEAYHEIRPVRRAQRSPRVVDVVGPICESGDFLAQDRELPSVEPGELLAVMSAGAYGFSMASRYNSRPLIPEVMVKGNRFVVIRERETYRDLVRGETIPAFLKGGR
ncbi:MAG TPA: diaminopimelate decarboxylase [Nitrospiria bacterium]|nr:diaminopimelate decarboxylase [Nitrospiria bacterium]